MELGAVRSDLTLDEEPLSVVEGLVGGFWEPSAPETPESEGEIGGIFHLDGDVCGEENAALGCHRIRSKDS